MIARSVAVRLLVACALLTGGTAAAAPTGDDVARAQALFDEARALARREEWTAACPLLEESQRLDPRPGTLLNLASCHEHTGRLALAWTEFREVLSRAVQDRREDRASIARERIPLIEARLAHLRIVLNDADAPGVRVLLDGSVLGAASLGISLPMDPGHHVVRVEAEGRTPFGAEFDASEGSSRDLVVDLAPVPTATEEAPIAPRASLPRMPPDLGAPTTTTSPPSLRIAGWITLGVGGVGVTLGAISGALALADDATVQERCTSATCPDDASLDASRRLPLESHLATAGLVAGGALVVGGLVLALVGPRARTSVVSLRAGACAIAF
ncbi:MAG: hypothetical protein U0414_03200 [Polyangiaceae bacterium]